jgi:hypothetical protein
MDPSIDSVETNMSSSSPRNVVMPPPPRAAEDRQPRSGNCVVRVCHVTVARAEVDTRPALF